MISKNLCEGCKRDIECGQCIVFLSKQREILEDHPNKGQKK